MLLENDVNLRALGEARALPADQAPLLFVKVGTGIGGGLITGAGELHHGADGAAGDIGHVRVRGGPDVRCVCGNVGCIEALASAGAIARRLGGGERRRGDHRRRPRRSWPGATRRCCGSCGRPPSSSARSSPRSCTSTTRRGSPSAARSPPRATTCSPAIRSVVYQRALPLATRNLVLANSVLGEFAGVAGAAVLGIERALSASEIGTLTPGHAALPGPIRGPCPSAPDATDTA